MADLITTQIRLATADDVAEVQRLYAETGLDGGKPIPLAAASDIFARFARYPSYRLWVAERDGAVVGTYALMFMDNIAHSGRPLAVVEQVGVDQRLQGQGLGKLMMQHAMSEAERAGCYKLMLSSHVDRTDAHAFYDKLGFERHGFGFIVRFREHDADPVSH